MPTCTNDTLLQHFISLQNNSMRVCVTVCGVCWGEKRKKEDTDSDISKVNFTF